MNIILLSFSLLFGLGAVGYCFLITSSYFVTNQILATLLLKIGIFLLLLAIFLYLIPLLSKSLSKLINSILLIIIIIIIIIAMVSLIFLSEDLFQFIQILLTGLIGGAYMMVFQLKLLKLSTGEVKNRLKFMIVGELIVALGMGIGSGFSRIPIFQNLEEILYLISVYLILIGLIILIRETFRFPGVLEFNWQKNLQKLFIVDQENHKGIYTFDFLLEKNDISMSENNFEAKKIENVSSIGIIGISKLFNSITESNITKLEQIRHGNSYVLLEYGDDPTSSIAYALLVEQDTSSVHFFLKKIKNQFQNLYKDILLNVDKNDGHEPKLFSNFDTILKDLTK